MLIQQTKTLLTVTVVALFGFANYCHADFVMDITPSSAPNAFGSPSWPGYVSNAMISIENGMGDIGDRETDPSAYETLMEGEVVEVGELIVSSFNSWRGTAGPPPPFDAEKGNRLHFGLHIIGDGTEQFRLADVMFEMSSSDDGNLLGFSGDYSGATHSSFRIGIDYGADRMKGGGDDSIINSGASDQLIDELIFVGMGNAFTAAGMGTEQENIDAIRQFFAGGVVQVTGSYSLNSLNGDPLIDNSTFVFFNAVPEPSSAMLACVFAVSCIARRRR